MKSTPSTKESETIELVTTRVNPVGLRFERTQMEELWLKCMAFWSGKQHFYIEGGQLRDLAADMSEHTVLYKANKCRAAVLRAVAKVQNVNATMRVRPASGSIKHRELAKLCDRLVEHQREVGDFRWTQTMSTLWKAICGSAFIKVYWNPDKGDPDRFFYGDAAKTTPIPEAMLSPMEVQEKEKQGLFLDLPPGEVQTAVVSPFAFFHDWTSRDKSVMGCRWAAERHYLDIPVVAEAFEIDEKDLQPDEGYNGLVNYEEAIAFMCSNVNTSPFMWNTPEDKRGRRCMYVEMWERPSRQYKRGRRIVYAGGKVLYDGENPYAASRSGLLHIPYVKDDWVPHPGRFWGASLMEDLTSPQYNLNDSRAKLAQHMRVFGQASTFVDDTTQLDTDNMTLEPGAVYKIPAGSKVQAGPTPQLPPEVLQFGELCEKDLLDAAAQSEIGADSLPGQMRSGEAIRLMNEERHVTLSIPAETTVRVSRDVGRMMLELGKLFYDERRMLRYLGEDQQWEVRYFTGADITSDIVVIGQPDVSDTLANQRSEMLDSVAAGAFNPQFDDETRTLILKGLHFNTSDEFMTSKLLAERNQEREIEMMIADPRRFMDRPFPVRPYENHEVEMRVLVRFMYGERFRSLDPDTQSIIEMHYQMHMMALAQQMQEQQAIMPQQEQRAPKGTPSQPRPK